MYAWCEIFVKIMLSVTDRIRNNGGLEFTAAILKLVAVDVTTGGCGPGTQLTPGPRALS